TIWKRPEVVLAMNGVLAGCVSITANCNIISPVQAILIGAIAGLVMVVGCLLLERIKIDDVVGAVPVHCFCGIWGTLAVALFGRLDAFDGRTRWEQLLVQAEGVLVACLWAFAGGYALFRLVNHFVPLRVSEQSELVGLNISEHGAGTELTELLNAMQTQRD